MAVDSLVQSVSQLNTHVSLYSLVTLDHHRNISALLLLPLTASRSKFSQRASFGDAIRGMRTRERYGERSSAYTAGETGNAFVSL
jgi:hypothetical protein